MADDRDTNSSENHVTETSVSIAELKSSLKSELFPPNEKISMENHKPVVKEVGGRGGLEPTRFGDWEKNGRCIDF